MLKKINLYDVAVMVLVAALLSPIFGVGVWLSFDLWSDWRVKEFAWFIAAAIFVQGGIALYVVGIPSSLVGYITMQIFDIE